MLRPLGEIGASQQRAGADLRNQEDEETGVLGRIASNWNPQINEQRQVRKRVEGFDNSSICQSVRRTVVYGRCLEEEEDGILIHSSTSRTLGSECWIVGDV